MGSDVLLEERQELQDALAFASSGLDGKREEAGAGKRRRVSKISSIVVALLLLGSGGSCSARWHRVVDREDVGAGHVDPDQWGQDRVGILNDNVCAAVLEWLALVDARLHSVADAQAAKAIRQGVDYGIVDAGGAVAGLASAQVECALEEGVASPGTTTGRRGGMGGGGGWGYSQ